MMEIDVLIEDDAWAALDLEAMAGAACAAVMDAFELEPSQFAFSILAADNARIAELNAEFRGKPTPTNVLSWPSEERAAAASGEMPHLPHPNPVGPPEELGDIALAFETCAAEATAAGKSLADHITHLIVHGAMHCLGFDHETNSDAALMEGLETRILARLGVPDPY